MQDYNAIFYSKCQNKDIFSIKIKYSSDIQSLYCVCGFSFLKSAIIVNNSMYFYLSVPISKTQVQNF